MAPVLMQTQENEEEYFPREKRQDDKRVNRKPKEEVRKGKTPIRSHTQRVGRTSKR